ncbi:MAG: helix-turn-helix transcriptional regulator [Helicobacter sp.]|nr:helix-turn-helix transcriptional regulator [Helicobacter sp.]
MYKYDEPVYTISIVAKILEIHPQTLRQYEKEHLIEPERTEGKRRLYSERDIDKIKTILRLTRDLGVNLAGVDIILRLKERLDELDELSQELKGARSDTKADKTKHLPQKTSYEIALFYKK